jgi:hypothetical protein
LIGAGCSPTPCLSGEGISTLLVAFQVDRDAAQLRSLNVAYYRQTQNAVNASTSENCDAMILMRHSLL